MEGNGKPFDRVHVKAFLNRPCRAVEFFAHEIVAVGHEFILYGSGFQACGGGKHKLYIAFGCALFNRNFIFAGSKHATVARRTDICKIEIARSSVLYGVVLCVVILPAPVFALRYVQTVGNFKGRVGAKRYGKSAFRVYVVLCGDIPAASLPTAAYKVRAARVKLVGQSVADIYRPTGCAVRVIFGVNLKRPVVAGLYGKLARRLVKVYSVATARRPQLQSSLRVA